MRKCKQGLHEYKVTYSHPEGADRIMTVTASRRRADVFCKSRLKLASKYGKAAKECSILEIERQ